MPVAGWLDIGLIASKDFIRQSLTATPIESDSGVKKVASRSSRNINFI
jgi:hypothetical protein